MEMTKHEMNSTNEMNKKIFLVNDRKYDGLKSIYRLKIDRFDFLINQMANTKCKGKRDIYQ